MLARSRRQRRGQNWRPGLLVRHDHQPPELHRRVGRGFGSGGDDALVQGDDLGQRVLAGLADLGALDRGASLGPDGVQALEGEQAFGELAFEGDEGFGGAGLGGG